MGMCVFCKCRHKKGSGITFYTFPMDSTVKLWLQKMKAPSFWKPKRHHLLCSNHFDKKCFVKKNRHTLLVPGSVPTIFNEFLPENSDTWKDHDHQGPDNEIHIKEEMEDRRCDWSDKEITTLVKYYFDNYSKQSIKWIRVGKLLNKSPNICKTNFEVLKMEHLNDFLSGRYKLGTRKPVDIYLDKIIASETKKKFERDHNIIPSKLSLWKTEEVDLLVQIIYKNFKLFEDPICHYVCWAAVNYKLKRGLANCRLQWSDLISVYRMILNDKKQNPDMEIDWRYMELFDDMFCNGMNTKLLLNSHDEQEDTVELMEIEALEFSDEEMNAKSNDEDSCIKQPDDFDTLESDNMYVDTLTENDIDDNKNNISDEEIGGTNDIENHESNESKDVDSKHFVKILEYYLKNKQKFSSHLLKKTDLWSPLALQLGLSAEECEDIIEMLRQEYITYVEREIDKPFEKITWPYYSFCKIVFGYTELKNELRSLNLDPEVKDSWLAKEIEQLIEYISKYFTIINTHIENKSVWTPLASSMGKTEEACKDKYLELRKCYRRIITKLSTEPTYIVKWKYFRMFDNIYAAPKPYPSDEEYMTERSSLKADVNDETDDDEQQDRQSALRWDSKSKKLLLQLYAKHIKENKGSVAKAKLCSEISKVLPNRSLSACQKMYRKLTKYNDAQPAVIEEDDDLNALTEISDSNSNVKLNVKRRIPSRKRVHDDSNERQRKYSSETDESTDITNAQKIQNKTPNNKTETRAPLWDSHSKKLLVKLYNEYMQKYKGGIPCARLWSEISEAFPGRSRKACERMFIRMKSDNKIWSEIKNEDNLTDESNIQITEIKTLSETKNEDDITDESHTQITEISDSKSKATKRRVHWDSNSKKLLLKKYLNYILEHEGTQIDINELWSDISKGFKNKTPFACEKMFTELRSYHYTSVVNNNETYKKSDHFRLFNKIFMLNPNFLQPQPGFEYEESWDDHSETLLLKSYLDHIKDTDKDTINWLEVSKSVPNKSASACERRFLKFKCVHYTKLAKDRDKYKQTELYRLFKKILAVSPLFPLRPTKREFHDTTTWDSRSKITLLRTYIEYLRKNNGKIPSTGEFWPEIARALPDKTAEACSRVYKTLRSYHRIKLEKNDEQYKQTLYCKLFNRLISLKDHRKTYCYEPRVRDLK